MGWIKRTFQILACLGLLVNISNSFDYKPTLDSSYELSQIELLISIDDVKTQVFQFDLAQQFFDHNSTKRVVDLFEWQNKIQIANTKYLSTYKVQKYTSLELKPTLLAIVLNDIAPRSNLV